MTTTLESRVHDRGSATTAWPPVARWEVLAVGAAMVVVAVVGVVAIGGDAPLLWDEAVYSLRVRDLVGAGVRGQYWIDVRAPGLPVLLSPVGLLPGVVLGGDAVALRVACLAYAVTGVGLTWLIARLLLGPSVAAVAAWLLATAPGWHDSSWQVMPDIPGAVLTLSAMAAVLYAAQGARLSWWALLAAPLAGAATLVRYGAPLLLAPVVLAALLLRWRTAASSTLRSITVLAVTGAAAALVWFVPPVSGSTRPPVFIFMARQDSKAIPAMESAADFLGALTELVGPVFGALVIVGGGVAAVAAVRRPSLRGPVIASGLVALGVLLLMLFGIAEYHVRYLTPCLPFLAILAAVGLTQLAARLPLGAVAGLAAAVAVAGVGVATATAVDRANEMLRTFGPARDAYLDIAEATAPPCVVLDNNPTAEWYTGCASFRVPRSPAALSGTLPRPGIAPDEPVFALLRNWPNVANPEPPVRALLEQAAVGAVDTSRRATVLDMGSVEDVIERLARHRALDRP